MKNFRIITAAIAALGLILTSVATSTIGFGWGVVFGVATVLLILLLVGVVVVKTLTEIQTKIANIERRLAAATTEQSDRDAIVSIQRSISNSRDDVLRGVATAEGHTAKSLAQLRTDFSHRIDSLVRANTALTMSAALRFDDK